MLSQPENILLADKDDDCNIKIIDFGMSRKAPRDDSLKTMCGSPHYVSDYIVRLSFLLAVFNFCNFNTLRYLPRSC